MMDIVLKKSMFPRLQDSIHALWAPVFFKPIYGSDEQFVVGVAALNEGGFHLEWANKLKCLNYLYGVDATAAINAIRISGEYLRKDLARRADKALTEPYPVVTGIVFGDVREVEGHSLERVAQNRMAALSSLYIKPTAEGMADSDIAVETAADGKGGSRDRLPFLVCSYIKNHRDGLVKFFSEGIRDGRQRRTKGTGHEIINDYSSSKIVANFCTLKANSLSSSASLIKQRFWDLIIERDKDKENVYSRKHEMILQHPCENDPQVNDKKRLNLKKVHDEFINQANQEGLHLYASNSVEEIGNHIISAESA